VENYSLSEKRGKASHSAIEKKGYHKELLFEGERKLFSKGRQIMQRIVLSEFDQFAKRKYFAFT